MKARHFLICCCFTFGFSFAQTDISSLEYFFNTDPGVGNGINIDINPDIEILNQNFTIATTGLQPGTHRLFLRTINADGTHSLYEHKSFRIAPAADNNSSDLVEAEYFFNQDPGVGLATSIDVIDGFLVDETLAIPTNTLPTGTHRLFVRTKNANGKHTLYEHKSFRIAPAADNNSSDLVEAEYFFNQDPGVGLATSIDVLDGGLVDETLTIPTNTLPTGTHRLFVRTKNANGKHSLYEHKTFRIAPASENNNTDLVEAEYFFNQDPGVGLATSIDVLDGSLVNETLTIPTNTLPTGTHRLFVRTKNANGKHSLYEHKSFRIAPASENNNSDLVEAEYFFNQDPGVGLATSIDVVDGSLVDETLTIPTNTLPTGTHRLFVRTKNSAGSYSLYEHKIFRIAPVSENNSANIIAAEYFIDADPGLGNATALTVSGNSINEDVIATTSGSLSQGDHYLYIRTKNADNKWSLYERQFFQVSGTLGVVNNTMALTVNIFPNPVSELLNIKLSESNKLISAKLYNLNGKLVLQEKSTQLNISQFSDGVYLLMLETEQGSLTKKIVKK